VLPGKTYTPDDFAKIAFRRKWAVLVPFFLVTLGTAVVAHFLPDQYRSETVILVVPQQVPESYVRSTVTTRIEDRLQSISQQILSRTRLERIIQDLNLYQKERRTGIMEDVIETMRRDIKVEVLKGDAFRVAYVGDNAMTVMKVTDRLASLFIEENLRDRETLAEGTSQFLVVQLEDARRRLVEQEKKLELYREQHTGELPSQADANLQAVQNTQMQIQQVVESLNRDRDRRLLVERQLADLNTEASDLNSSGENVSDLPVALQLAKAQQDLHALELRLKPEHPDILRMKRSIAGLQQRAEAEALTGPVSPEADTSSSPAQQLKRHRAQELQLDLDSLDRQIAAKTAEEDRLRKVAAVYHARLEAVPTRETELVELTRDYSTLQQMYASLLAKNEESKIAANLERRQIGEQFKLLDPARPAEKPFSPNRVRIDLFGLVGALGLGLFLAGFLEYRDSTFRTQDEVTSVLSLPVLGQIPVLSTPLEQRLSSRRRLALSAATALAFTGCAVMVWKLGMIHDLIR
jgi:polysaccharide chain length determinant protein (PEP-CTERM system associated)